MVISVFGMQPVGTSFVTLGEEPPVTSEWINKFGDLLTKGQQAELFLQQNSAAAAKIL